MADDKKQPEAEAPEAKSRKKQEAEKKSSPEKNGSEKSGDKNDKWITGAKVGAAVGSAAIAAALIYAGRHKIRKLDEFKTPKPKSGMRYENEPVDDIDDEGKE